MNHRSMFLAFICMAVTFMAAGCMPENKAAIPITGGLDASIPLMVGAARDTVLGYVIRLAAIPPSAEWQLDDETSVEGEYRFRSGDWLMIVQMAGDSNEDQRVMLINQLEGIYWCGCVHPDGTVLDTSLRR
jgi:hypothetical protein